MGPFHIPAGGLLVLLLIPVTARADIIASYDLVDDFLATGGYTGAGTYDVFNGSSGTATPDGLDDFSISISTFGLGDDGNNARWTAGVDTTGTGLRSSISTTFVGAGGVTANNFGHRAIQEIEFRFLAGMTVEAEDIVDLSWSSGNTAARVWEVSMIQFLDQTGALFSPTPVISPFLSHVPTSGVASLGNFVGDSNGTVTGVGTSSTSSGSNGALDSISGAEPSDPISTGISAGTVLGGFRFTHFVEDVRGTSNGTSSVTNTLNDFQLSNFEATAVPEPSATIFTGLILSGFVISRRRRKSRVADEGAAVKRLS